jgi:hypothetical protein
MRIPLLLALAATPIVLAGCDKVDLPFLPKSDAQLIQGAWACTSDQNRGLSGLTLDFAKNGKAKMVMKGEANQGIMSMGVDVDINLDYTLAARTLSMKSTGGKVNKLTVNGEAIDVAAMGGADSIGKKMAEDMKLGDSAIDALDAKQLVLKPKDGGTLTCKRPAA